MRRLFDMEGPLMGFLFKVFDCMGLSLLWLLFSLPVITMGAASAALYATVRRCLQDNEGHMISTFWNAFRENFKRSTLCWLIQLAVLALLVLDAAVFRSMKAGGDLLGNLYWVILFLICAAVTWCAYISAYCARCNGSVWEVLRISFLLMLLHPLRALVVFFPIFCCGVVALMVPGIAILLPAPLCWLGSKTFEQVLRLHMQPEDLEREASDDE